MEMSAPIVVHKNRTNIVPVSLGFDVSGDTFASEIRTAIGATDPASLIATWTVSFKTNGIDGEILLTLDNSALAAVTHTTGYMDIKRTSGGEPFPVFDAPLQVVFRGTVTA
jgi:hypothetical protein